LRGRRKDVGQRPSVVRPRDGKKVVVIHRAWKREGGREDRCFIRKEMSKPLSGELRRKGGKATEKKERILGRQSAVMTVRPEESSFALEKKLGEREDMDIVNRHCGDIEVATGRRRER